MSEATQRDRSPAFPVIPLEEALERLEQFEAHFKRSSARPEKVGEAWNISAKSYADRIAAALRYFGLLDYQTQGSARSIVISDEGRKYLRAQQDEIKREVIKAAALRPKQIATFWNLWAADRPADAACIDDLTLKHGFSDKGARDFLKVYDATIRFSELSKPDKKHPVAMNKEQDDDDQGGQLPLAERGPIMPSGATPLPHDSPHRQHSTPGSQPPRHGSGVRLMEGERELTTGLLSKDASFRLIVSGKVGEKEIERLIRKLELDKEILAEANDADTEERPRFQPRTTHSDNDKLRAHGYTDEQIDAMGSFEAKQVADTLEAT